MEDLSANNIHVYSHGDQAQAQVTRNETGVKNCLRILYIINHLNSFQCAVSLSSFTSFGLYLFSLRDFPQYKCSL